MTSSDGAADPPLHDDRIAAALRGFGPLGILAILLILAGNFLFTPLSAILVLVWAGLSRTPWRDIGYVRPKSWIRSLAIGIAFGCAFKWLMKAIVMPLLGAPAINQAFHDLVGNTAALPEMMYVILVGAGFGEETLFRGYAFERFGKLFGSSTGENADRAHHLRVVWRRPLPGPGTGRSRTGAHRRGDLRHYLCADRPNLRANDCARRVRCDRGGHHLLESRNQCGPLLFQVADPGGSHAVPQTTPGAEDRRSYRRMFAL